MVSAMVHNGILVAFCLLVIEGFGFGQCEKLHDLLTDEEFSRVFHTTRENVPDYEVVPIMHDLRRRSPRSLKLQFTAFSRDLNIHLNPTDGILAGENTPVWLASAGSDGEINFKKLSSNIVGKVAKSFRSRRSLAAFVVDDSTHNNPRFEGTIDDLNVVPWPARLQEAAQEELRRSKREVPNSSGSLKPTDYHVIFKTKSSPDGEIALGKQVDDMMESFDVADGQRAKRAPADVMYPTILVVTDYAGTPTGQEEWRFHDEIRYQLAFWNSVDLRFRNLTEPKIRLRIGGIVFGQGRKATPYIYNSMIGKSNQFDANRAFGAKAEYWYEQSLNISDFSRDGYNAIVTLTDAGLRNPELKKNMLGLAYMSVFCDRPSGLLYRTIALVHDEKKYDGILTAVHELGHMFGAAHDDKKDGECAAGLGYIMTPVSSRTTLMNRWSPCSVRKIQRFMGFYFARDCAHQPAEKHRPGKAINRIAPGDKISAQSQCETQGYSWACDPTPRTCKKLQCWLGGIYGLPSNWRCLDAPLSALDGTPCKSGSNAICIGGECQEPNTN